MKSSNLKDAKKDLAKSISDKFLEVIKSLGHDADKLNREIKKAGRFVAKKIARKEKDEVKKGKEAVKKTKKDLVKNEQKIGAELKGQSKNIKKVIARATKSASTAIKQGTSKSVAKPVPEMVSKTVKAVSSKESEPKEVAKKPSAVARKTNQKKQPAKGVVDQKED